MPPNDPLRVAFLEVFERDNRLLVRPPVSHAVLGVIMFLAFELVGWGLIYVNFTHPSSDWQLKWETTGPMRPWSEHSLGDQLATIAVLTFFCGAFIAAGAFALRMGLLHFRPWTFWHDGSRGSCVSRGRRNWPLAPTGAVRLRETRIFFTRVVVMEMETHAPDGEAPPPPLRIHRMFENSGLSVTEIREQMRQLAERVAAFTGMSTIEQNRDAEVKQT